MVSAIRLENTNANIGEHNFIKSIAIEKNPEMVISDCLCHILHNASSKAADALNDVVKGTVMQIEKALINDCLRVSKYAENFAVKLFTILQ